jgi:prepilin-type N-terminal cleavage/methylation domain-containing protein
MFHAIKSKSKGFSLVELGIVLGIVGIALLYVMTKFSESSNSGRALSMSQDLNQIITNAQRFYSTQPAFPPAGTAWNLDVLRENNVFPARWIGANGQVVSPFGGQPNLFTPFAPATTQNGGMIIPNVPSRICPKLVEAMSSNESILGIWVGAGAPGNFAVVRGLNDRGTNVNVIGTGCSQADNVQFSVIFGRN